MSDSIFLFYKTILLLEWSKLYELYRHLIMWNI